MYNRDKGERKITGLEKQMNLEARQIARHEWGKKRIRGLKDDALS